MNDATPEITPDIALPENKKRVESSEGEEKDRATSEKDLSRITLFIPEILQFLAWFPAWFLLKDFTSFQAGGTENIKELHRLKKEGRLGGVIFAANHASEIDPIVVRAAMGAFSRLTPLYYVARVRSFYEGKGFFEKYIYGGRFFRWWGAYPAYSGLGNYQKSLTHHIELLKRGKSVLIFPEGGKTRDGNLREAHGGIAFLVHELALPVVPVRIEGTFNMGRKGFFTRKNRVRVTFGEVLSPNDIFDGGTLSTELSPEAYRKAASRILQKTQSI